MAKKTSIHWPELTILISLTILVFSMSLSGASLYKQSRMEHRVNLLEVHERITRFIYDLNQGFDVPEEIYEGSDDMDVAFEIFLGSGFRNNFNNINNININSRGCKIHRENQKEKEKANPREKHPSVYITNTYAAKLRQLEREQTPAAKTTI